MRAAQSRDEQIKLIHGVVRTQHSLQSARDNSDIEQEKLALKSYHKACKSAGKRLAGIAHSTFEDVDGLLYYADANRQFPVPIIDAELGQKAISMAHGMMLTAHIGIQRCKDFIRLRYWWIGMKADIENHIRHCIHCQKAKFEAQPGYGFSHLRYYAGPAQCIAIDIVVLNHASPRGTKYLFTILDCFSHWPEAVPMKDMTAESCARALWQWIRQQGAPIEIRSDRGLNLNLSKIFKELYKIMRIKGVLNAAWSPQSNQVERLHKWLGAALRLLFDQYDLDVDEAAEVAIYIYRSTPCLVTKFTPYMLDKGREPRFPTDIFEGKRAEVTETEYVDHLQQVLPQIWKAAVAARMEAQEVAAEYYNEKHGIPINVVTGDLVFCEDHAFNMSDLPAKVLPKCTGPWRIIQVTSRSAKLKHIYSGIEKSANLRHLRKVRGISL